MQIINGGLLVKRSYSVELAFSQVGAAGVSVNFKDVQQLRAVVVYGIELFTQDQLTKAKSGNPVVTLAQMATATLTISEMGVDKIVDQPCTSFVASVNGGMFRLYDGIILNLPKSRVTLNDAGILPNTSIVAAFYYEKLSESKYANYVSKVKANIKGGK